MAKQPKRRLRKKLHIDEFQELGFYLSVKFQTGLSQESIGLFWCDFIAEAIEQNNLVYGGGTDGFVSLDGRGSVTESHRELIQAWLSSRPEISAFQAAQLSDAWYPTDT